MKLHRTSVWVSLAMIGCVGELGSGTPVETTTTTSTTTAVLSAETVLGVHFAHDDEDPEHRDVLEMFDGRPGYTVELVYAVSDHPEWLPGRRAKIRSIADAGFEVILRVDWRGGVNVPPAGSVDDYADFIVREVVEPLASDVRIYVLGNEPNLDLECREGLEHCTPSHYADVYRRVRARIHEVQPGAEVLLAGVSPGPVVDGRWMSSDDYWSELLSELEPGEVDGIAMHSYGGGTLEGSVAMFSGDLQRQLEIAREHGYGGKDVYITELNRRIDGADDEATSARFLTRAYGFIADWNDAESTPAIRAACWYVYAGRGDGNPYSLRDWKTPGASPDEDVWHAFLAVARGGESDEPAPPTHPVHRSYSYAHTDHLYSLDLGEVSAAGYALEHADYFHLRDAQTSDTVTLWRCYSASRGDHFLTTSSTCEGSDHMVREGRMGYIATRRLPGTVPLYRLYGNTDHFFTISAAEREAAESAYGYHFEGITGYVWTR